MKIRWFQAVADTPNVSTRTSDIIGRFKVAGLLGDSDEILCSRRHTSSPDRVVLTSDSDSLEQQSAYVRYSVCRSRRSNAVPTQKEWFDGRVDINRNYVGGSTLVVRSMLWSKSSANPA